MESLFYVSAYDLRPDCRHVRISTRVVRRTRVGKRMSCTDYVITVGGTIAHIRMRWDTFGMSSTPTHIASPLSAFWPSQQAPLQYDQRPLP